MKLWILTTFYTVSLLILSGCAVKPTPKSEPILDDSLPIVKLTQNGTISDTNNIALEWEAIRDPRVKGIYIYKATIGEDSATKDDYYDTVRNRFTTHYLDTEIEPNTKYNYYFKTYSNEAESLPSAPTLVASLPRMESVSWIHSIMNMPRSAKVIWRPHPNEKVKGYIIQRRTLEAEKWTDVATVDGRLQAEYIDKKLKDQYTYIYRIKSITYDNLTSKPSKEVKVITKALPMEVQNIRATTKLPKKIEIKWDETKTKDFSTYRLYRSSSHDSWYSLLKELKTNFYVDNIEEDGKQYFYRVSVVDKDGLESIYDKYSEMGTTLVKPKTPSLVAAEILDGKIKISWSKDDSRAKSYIVQKKYKVNLFKWLTEDFEGIVDLSFIDKEVEAGKTYSYTVFSVDENSIKSEPSIEVVIKTDELLNSQKALQLQETVNP